MKLTQERILREYIRRSLREEWGDYGGVTPWSMGQGGSSKHTKSSSSYGTYGNSLYSIFIDPFVQAAKVIGAELGQTGVRVVALMSTAIENVLDTLLPGFQADYDKIDKIQKKYLEKIKEKYKPAYEAVAENWNHPDIQLFAFMHDPTTWLTYKAITSKPEAALSVYEAIAEGSNTLTLYLRDIRNRLFGASVPGAGLYGSTNPLPVKSESIKRSLKKAIRENGDIFKKIKFKGLDIAIDRPKGFIQTGTNANGKDWKRTYLYDYGFIKGTEGGDGEDLDVFVGPDHEASEAYIVTQNHEDGSFDEYKAFIGFNTEEDALEAYEAHIPIKYFQSISTVPVGLLKGMLGMDPMKTEAKTVKKKTPGEQLADILTSKQFQAAISRLPIVQQMKTDAESIENHSTSQLQSQMSPILSATNAQDLAAASGGSWSLPPEYNQLPDEQKKVFDDTVVKQVKASMASYYESRLKDLLKQLNETGINDQSPYATSIRRMINSLEPVKQQAAVTTDLSRELNVNDKTQTQKRNRTTDTTGRVERIGNSGGGIYKQDPNNRSGDGSSQSGQETSNGRLQRKAGHKNAERSIEDRKDQKFK